jgi:flagellar biosynthesis/type III secretory pathway chaperone
MSISINEIKIAIERLITLNAQHESTIENLQTILQIHNDKFSRLQIIESNIDGLNKKVDNILNSLSNLTTRFCIIESRLNIVELETTTDHQLNEHKQTVVRDWKLEANAGISNLDDAHINNKYKLYRQ